MSLKPVLTLLVWLALAVPVAAQTRNDPPGLHILDIGIGFHSSVELPNVERNRDGAVLPRYFGKPDQWLPFQIDLENTGPDIEGVLVVEGAFMDRKAELRFEHKIVLPRGARKRFMFPVFYSDATQLQLSLENERGGSLSPAGWSGGLIPEPAYLAPGGYLALVVTNQRLDVSHFLSRRDLRAYVPDQFVVPVTPEQLSGYEAVLESVDTIIIDDLPLDAFPEDVLSAVEQYVRRGGTLMVCGRQQAERQARSDWGRLLPGDPAEVQNLSALDSLRNLTNFDCTLNAPVAVTTYAWRPGAQAWGADNVMGSRPYGNGTVICCGFPLSSGFLEIWPGSPMILAGLPASRRYSMLPSLGSAGLTKVQGLMPAALLQSVVRLIPSTGLVSLMMLAYVLAVVVVPFLGFRRFGRMEWAWALVAVFALGGTGAVYATGRSYFIKESSAVRVGIVEGGAEGGVCLRRNYWSVFSAEGESMELDFEDSRSLPTLIHSQNIPGKRSDTRQLTLNYTGARISKFRTYTQDSRVFESLDGQRLPAGIDLSRDQEGFLMKFPAALPLRRAWVVADAAIHPLAVSAEGRAVSSDALTMEQIRAALKREGEDDKVFADAAMILIQEAEARATQHNIDRILVYAYDGAPALSSAGLTEREYDFGVMYYPRDGSTWTANRDSAGEPASVNMNCRQLTPIADTSDNSNTIKSAEIMLYLRGVERDTLESLSLRSFRGSNLTVAMYDVRENVWREQRLDRPIPCASYVNYSPAGEAQIRCRLVSQEARANDRSRYSWYSNRYSFNPLAAMAATATFKAESER